MSVNVNHTAWENNVGLSPSKQPAENEGELSNHQEGVCFSITLHLCFWRHWHSECSRLLQYQNRNQLLGYFYYFFSSRPPDSNLRGKKQPIMWWLIEPVALRARYSLITEQVWRKWWWRIICLCFLRKCPHQSDGIDTPGTNRDAYESLSFLFPTDQTPSRAAASISGQIAVWVIVMKTIRD